MARRKSRLTPPFAFDPRLGSTGRYVDVSSGQMVPAQMVNDALEFQIKDAQQNVNAIAKQLANAEISLAEYQVAMAQEMKTVNTISGALAKGGWANMSQADWGAVGRISRDQYKALEDFAVSISKGKTKLRRLDGEINGQFLRISDQFAQGGVQTHSQMERRTAAASGATHERRVLDPGAEHCECCKGQAGHWEPIGALRKIGDCDCANNCRCHFIYGREVDGKIEEI